MVPVDSSKEDPEDILYSELSGGGDAEVSDEAITLLLKRVLHLEILQEGILF